MEVKVGEHGCDRSCVSREVVFSDETSCKVLDVGLLCLCPPPPPRLYLSLIVAPYSQTARTRAMFAVRLLFIGHLRIFRLRKPSFVG